MAVQSIVYSPSGKVTDCGQRQLPQSFSRDTATSNPNACFRAECMRPVFPVLNPVYMHTHANAGVCQGTLGYRLAPYTPRPNHRIYHN